LVSKRIIPCLDVKDGRVVKGTNFINLKDAGPAVELSRRYYEEGADELVFLDITATEERRKTLIELVRNVAAAIRIPFTVGGGISTLDDIDNLLKAGADKVSLNSAIVRNPELITQASKRFGSQAVVAAVDVKTINGTHKVFIKGGKEETVLEGISWCGRVVELGAGEILLTSMDRDGTRCGYDLELLKTVCGTVSVPVIASGGAGSKEDFLDAFLKADVEACLAAGLFHYNELNIGQLKAYLKENNIRVRM
jgi:imidazole glycerol-phosphate synthase subunit HisF